MYLSLISLPLLGSIFSGFFGRKIGVTGAISITCTAVVITTIFAVVTFIEVGLNNKYMSMQVFRWIDCESLDIWWAFLYDSLTVSMLIPVLIISSLVHFYSIGYMDEDPHIQRFFSYLSLFTFMMLILVTANSYLLMFVGWEGVGVCSYLLVCFWFTRIAANQSALSAFLTNRVGDCFLTIGMFILLVSFGNLDYSTVFSLSAYMNTKTITIAGICLFIGAMAKSSQVGLHAWLPMAMEGPTPVSALIHAATMVTAGVYLLMRSSPLIEYSSTVLSICLFLGAITTIVSSLIGFFQQDIKKVIAYSTMSQLGMMVIAVGLSCHNIALFHLVNHAFYKGLLFLGAGSVIHAVADNQDFRKYGGLRPFLPLTYTVMLIASLSLIAFPFMTGFYSKDFILESAYGKYDFYSTVIYIIATIGAMFTTLYSVKVLYLTFLTNPNGPLINYKQAHEGNIFMSLPLMILAIFSIFFGFITKDMFIGLGSGFFVDNALFIHPSHEISLDTEFGVPTILKLLPFIFTATLTIIYIVFSEYFSIILIFFKLSRIGYNTFSFFNQRFYIELFYNKFITNNVLKLGGQTTKSLDKGSIELVGPYGLEKGVFKLSINIAGLSTGNITSYGLFTLVGLIFYILAFVYFYSYTNMLLISGSIFLILCISVILATRLITNTTNNILQSGISIDWEYIVKIIFKTIAISLWLRIVLCIITYPYLGLNYLTFLTIWSAFVLLAIFVIGIRFFNRHYYQIKRTTMGILYLLPPNFLLSMLLNLWLNLFNIIWGLNIDSAHIIISSFYIPLENLVLDISLENWIVNISPENWIFNISLENLMCFIFEIKDEDIQWIDFLNEIYIYGENSIDNSDPKSSGDRNIIDHNIIDNPNYMASSDGSSSESDDGGPVSTAPAPVSLPGEHPLPKMLSKDLPADANLTSNYDIPGNPKLAPNNPNSAQVQCEHNFVPRTHSKEYNNTACMYNPDKHGNYHHVAPNGDTFGVCSVCHAVSCGSCVGELVEVVDTLDPNNNSGSDTVSNNNAGTANSNNNAGSDTASNNHQGNNSKDENSKSNNGGS